MEPTAAAESGPLVPLLLSAIVALAGVVAYLFHKLLAERSKESASASPATPAAAPKLDSKPDSGRVRQIAREEIDAALGPAAAPVQALRRARAELEKAEEDLRRAEKEATSAARRKR